MLPILIIALMAIAEFGLLLSNTQYLEMSSRAGAQVAAEFPTLPESGAVPASVVAAVNQELAQRGLPVAREIRLEHDVDTGPPGTPPFILKSGPGPSCPDPTDEPAAPSGASGRNYVRVTVCVNTTDLTPNLLKTFGVDLSERVSQQTTTWRYKP